MDLAHLSPTLSKSALPLSLFHQLDRPNPPLFSCAAVQCRVKPNGANLSKVGFDDETNKAATREMSRSFREACRARLVAKVAFALAYSMAVKGLLVLSVKENRG